MRSPRSVAAAIAQAADVFSHPLRLRGRERWAVWIYSALASLLAAALLTEGRWWTLLALPPAILGVWGIVVSTIILRVSYYGLGVGDQWAVRDAAWDRILSGLSPYGHAYSEAILPNTPWPYGPLALFDSFAVELAASAGIATLLVSRPITLALFAGLPFSVYLVAAANNDYVATFLLAAGILTLPRWYGGALVGLSVAWKPYTALFLPALMPSGVTTFLAGFAVAVAGYVPVLWWGVGGFLQSLTMMSSLAGESILRYVAVPISLVGVRYGVWTGVAAFAIFTVAGGLWSLGYLIPLGVAVGILTEAPTRRHNSQALGNAA